MIFDPEDQRLTAFALGELEEADRLAVEALLADSPEARRFVDEVRESADLLTKALKNETSPGLSIVQRIDLDAKLGGRPSKKARGSMVRVLLSAAAGLLLTVGGFTLGLVSTVQDRPTASVAINERADSVIEPGLVSKSENDMGDADGLSESFVMMAPGSLAADAPSDLEVKEDLDAESSRSLPSIRDDNSPIIASRRMTEYQAAPTSPAPSAPSATPGRSASRQEAISPLPLSVSERGNLETSNSDPDRSKAARQAKDQTLAEVERNVEASDRSVAGKDERSGEDAFGERQAGQIPASQPAPASLPPSIALAPAPFDQRPRMQVDVPALMNFNAEAVIRDSDSGAIRQAKIEPGNIVEIVAGPERNLEQRIALDAPIRGLSFTQDGLQLMATTADKGVSVFDIRTGQLVNSIRVDLGPVPVARFGGPGELVLSNMGGGRTEMTPGVPWIVPQREPVAAIPTNPGRLTLADLAATIADDHRPIAPELTVLALINGVDYPYDRPLDETSVAVDLATVPTPWNAETRLVRVAVIARAIAPDEDASSPPVVAEQVSAEIEFNPASIAAYRPIGFEGDPGAIPDTALGTLRAGRSITTFFEIEPVRSVTGKEEQERPYRYRDGGNSELLTVSLSWSEPGEERRSASKSLLIDEHLPIDEAPDDVRFGSALAWFGMLARGAEDVDPEALGKIAGLVQSCDEGFLPEDQRVFLGLIDRLRRGPPPLAAPEP